MFIKEKAEKNPRESARSKESFSTSTYKLNLCGWRRPCASICPCAVTMAEIETSTVYVAFFLMMAFTVA